MANKNIFPSQNNAATLPVADSVNEAGGVAYKMTDRHALAQYAVTGCLNSTFYASAEVQLAKVLECCSKVDDAFIARTEVYCREKGYMKDMPALLCAVLVSRNPVLLRRIFGRVINDGKMVRNFVQILRSGATGRKSLGTVAKRLVQEWLETRTPEQVFRASVGTSPSMADVIKMVHPKPVNAEREALYGYMINRRHNAEALPGLVKQFEAFKLNPSSNVPDVPFQMLTALELGRAGWTAIARQAPWQTTRMNLNTFARHGVFEDSRLTTLVASRLSKAEEVKRSRVFPYQLMAAYKASQSAVPQEVSEALQDAMELAIDNVPSLKGRVVVCPDVSGSMRSPVTGVRQGATTSVQCVDVAALVAAAVLRKNPKARVLPFEQDVVPVQLNPRDSVMTNAAKLAAVGGGGTCCSAPLAKLNAERASADLVVFVSDNESWIQSEAGKATRTLQEWNGFKRYNPSARLVCIDIQPSASSQAPDRKDILNVGGFSDTVFDVVSQFAKGELGAEHWAGCIESITL